MDKTRIIITSSLLGVIILLLLITLLLPTRELDEDYINKTQGLPGTQLPTPSLPDQPPTQTPDQPPTDSRSSCTTDADCVPSTCCHPTQCTNNQNAPDCSDTFCTLECKPGTLDCNQGTCLCINNRCTTTLNK